MIAKLTLMFGVLALVLAAVGLYGVTAYTVEQRTGEIGIRMALGADRGRVLSMVLRAAFTQVVFGLMIGIPAAIGAGWLMTHQLYGVKPYDPAVCAGGAGVGRSGADRRHDSRAKGRRNQSDECAAQRVSGRRFQVPGFRRPLRHEEMPGQNCGPGAPGFKKRFSVRGC
jgi:ABC-type antimicrobial peptide transport system permease subunit